MGLSAKELIKNCHFLKGILDCHCLGSHNSEAKDCLIHGGLRKTAGRVQVAGRVCFATLAILQSHQLSDQRSSQMRFPWCWRIYLHKDPQKWPSFVGHGASMSIWGSPRGFPDATFPEFQAPWSTALTPQ